ncbi:MAG: hypothetical protein ABIW76_02985 [Fibrobacteria bacterium]
MVDVAPTVFAYLGLPVSEAWKWDGRPIGYAPAPRAAARLASSETFAPPGQALQAEAAER